MSFFRRVWEALRGGKAALLPAHRAVYGETPSVTLSDLITIYLKDYACKAAVDFLADQVVGAGFYTTANEQYPQAEQAKQRVDDFCEAVGLDEMLQIGAREVIATGNSFWEKITPDLLENLKIIPISSIQKIMRDQYGEVQGYKQTSQYGGKLLAPERIIHFRWNPINGDPFGTGILRVLYESLAFGDGSTREALIKYKARIEKIMPDIFEKYAGPDELWVFENATDDQIADYQRLIKAKPKAGARFVYNRPADIKTVTVDARARFEGYIEYIYNQFILGLQTPLPKLITTPGFTEASARAALDLAERRVLGIQRFIKRIVEREIFVPVIKQAGFDPVKARVRLNWGMPEKPELVTADIIRAWELGAIRTSELRKILIDMGWPLEAEEPKVSPVPTPEVVEERYIVEKLGPRHANPKNPRRHPRHRSHQT